MLLFFHLTKHKSRNKSCSISSNNLKLQNYLTKEAPISNPNIKAPSTNADIKSLKEVMSILAP